MRPGATGDSAAPPASASMFAARTSSPAPWPRHPVPFFPPRSASGGTGAACERRAMLTANRPAGKKRAARQIEGKKPKAQKPKGKKRELTVPDLVLLSLLAEE